ncbi:ABC transporter permease [Larkinella bovis]|uniref:ABC transporter permease n=1 Tax=Larkinella bovis TaxID=683041 RepID=A0ABW0I863_9BACT
MKKPPSSQPTRPPVPPPWADRLLKWFCPPCLLEELLGDLHEQFADQVDTVGIAQARRFYALEVIKFCRPYFLKRKATSLTKTATGPVSKTAHRYPVTHEQPPFFLHPDMLRNYLKIAFRTLWKSKGYAAINVVGLAVAFCICVFLFLTSYLQLTYDSFHADGDRIFQPYLFANHSDKTTRNGAVPLPFLPALKSSFPEVEAATCIMSGRKSLVEVNQKYFDKLVVHTNPDFFKVFSFPLLKGNRELALRDLSSIVINETMAQTLFGAADPMGKTVLVGSIGSQKQYVVTGVIGDAPINNSTIQYDALVRIETAPNYQEAKTDWNAYFYPVYLKLSPQVDQATFENRLKPFAAKYFPGTLEELNKKGAQPDQRGDVFAVRLQKLADIHFDREISNGRGVPIALVYTLLGIGFFILLIACSNFINLSIARSFTRAREVGVRKALGALKNQLFVQIWGESTVICLIGFLLGLVLAYLLLPQFNATFDARLRLEAVFKPGFMALILAVFGLVTLVAGGYPAWQMTKFNTVEVLKGKVSLKRPGILRNSLIVTQFTLSCLLACCTIIAAQQVDYLRSRPLGFEKEQVISIPVGNQVDGRQVLGRLRNKLANDPSVLAITGTSVNIGRGRDRVSSRTTIGYTYKGKEVSTDWLLIDYDYLKTLNIKPISGRDFSRLYATDSVNRVIITASMAKLLGEKNPVGLLLGDDGDTTGTKSQVIGVIPDFQLYSLSDQAKPITLHLSNSETIHYIFVRVTPQSLAGAMEKLKTAWQEVAPQSEFLATYLDENVDAWYQNEERMAQICSLASGVAILLSCLGLFAVARMVIEQRTKEIGIRKVMGASIPNIIVVLSRDFVKLVLISLLIAMPLAWLLMTTWLSNYRERIPISLWVFTGVGLAAILIALATVSFQTIKAALVNPVKSLRSE